jgi:hypothetical protein
VNYRILATILTVLVATTHAGEQGQDEGLDDIRTLLKKGDDSGSLPRHVTVRVVANLWNSDDKHLKETWEITAEHVHRVVLERVGNEAVYRRAESRPYDSKHTCRLLLDGGIHAIATQEGMGEPLQFVGTEFEYGHRSIEILVDGQSAMLVGESCACGGFAASNARAFANLYEKLASEARSTFRHAN